MKKEMNKKFIKDEDDKSRIKFQKLVFHENFF